MTRRLLGLIHLWIGVVLCVPLVVLGLSGSLLVSEDVWAPLLDTVSGPAAAGEAKPIADILAAAQAAVPAGFAPTFYRLPAHEGERASVRLAPIARDRQGPGRNLRVDIDPVSLRAYGDLPSNRVTGFVHSLHANFLMASRQVVGWLGVAMLALGVSGLVNWWPSRRWRDGFVVARGARGIALLRQLHGAAGIWVYAVFIAVSLSGVYLAFPQSVRGGIDMVLPARDLRAAANAVKALPAADATAMPVDEAVALAREKLAGTRVDFVRLPSRPDQPYRIALLRNGQTRGEPAATVFVDPWARRVVAVMDPRAYSLGEWIMAWQHAIHSGAGGGTIWKTLVFLTGFLPLLFAITGVSMWRMKRAGGASVRPQAGAASDRLPSAGRAAE